MDGSPPLGRTGRAEYRPLLTDDPDSPCADRKGKRSEGLQPTALVAEHVIEFASLTSPATSQVPPSGDLSDDDKESFPGRVIGNVPSDSAGSGVDQQSPQLLADVVLELHVQTLQEIARQAQRSADGKTPVAQDVDLEALRETLLQTQRQRLDQKRDWTIPLDQEPPQARQPWQLQPPQQVLSPQELQELAQLEQPQQQAQQPQQQAQQSNWLVRLFSSPLAHAVMPAAIVGGFGSCMGFVPAVGASLITARIFSVLADRIRNKHGDLASVSALFMSSLGNAAAAFLMYDRSLHPDFKVKGGQTVHRSDSDIAAIAMAVELGLAFLYLIGGVAEPQEPPQQ
jgi:hypothetical protein